MDEDVVIAGNRRLDVLALVYIQQQAEETPRWSRQGLACRSGAVEDRVQVVAKRRHNLGLTKYGSCEEWEFDA